MVPYAGDALAAGLRAAVDRGAFTDGHIVPDFHIGYFAFEFQVLRHGTDHGAREHLAAASHFHILVDDRMGMDLAAVADLYIGIDIGIGPDFNIVAQFCVRADAGERVDFVHTLSVWDSRARTARAACVLMV